MLKEEQERVRRETEAKQRAEEEKVWHLRSTPRLGWEKVAE